MSISRLVYYSSFRIDRAAGTDIEQLNAILRVANRNNQDRCITGALIFDNSYFVQALEGEHKAVWATFQKIAVDPRHADITIVELVNDVSRHFGDWWMGCAERNGLNADLFAPYLQDGHFQPAGMTASQILSLLIDLEDGGLARALGD